MSLTQNNGCAVSAARQAGWLASLRRRRIFVTLQLINWLQWNWLLRRPLSRQILRASLQHSTLGMLLASPFKMGAFSCSLDWNPLGRCCCCCCHYCESSMGSYVHLPSLLMSWCNTIAKLLVCVSATRSPADRHKTALNSMSLTLIPPTR